MASMNTTTQRKPTVAQRMNRKTASACAWCPESIYSADEAVIATVTLRDGSKGYSLVHIECESEFVAASEA